MPNSKEGSVLAANLVIGVQLGPTRKLKIGE